MRSRNGSSAGSSSAGASRSTASATRALGGRLGVGAGRLLGGQRAVALLGQALALRDVDHQAAEVAERAAVAADRLHGVADPHGAAVGSRHPVLEPALAAHGDAAQLGQRALPVVGMDEPRPEGRIGEPLAKRIAEQALGAMVDEGELERVGVSLPHDRVETVHEAGEARVGFQGVPVLAAVVHRGRRPSRQLLRDGQVGRRVGVA
jgi:hypothetical protein